MGRLTLTEMVYLALRGEYVHSKDGGYPTGLTTDIDLFEGTLMVGLPVGSNYELRVEVRGDFSDEDVFLKGERAARQPVHRRPPSWRFSNKRTQPL